MGHVWAKKSDSGHFISSVNAASEKTEYKATLELAKRQSSTIVLKSKVTVLSL